MTLVSIEKLGGGSDVGADSGLPVTVEPLEFEVGRLEEVDELGIGGSSGTTAVNVGSYVVDLLAVLFDYDGTSCGSGISCEYNSFIVFDSHNGGSCLFVRKWLDNFFLLEELVSE